jgi:NAD(P)-dependent dehydrogenase (short-subunit alcohol dehydrogenase family)
MAVRTLIGAPVAGAEATGAIPMNAQDDTAKAVDWFAGKLAVVTGGGSGMGRELVCQLAARGCSVAACDLDASTIAETVTMAMAGARADVLVTGHACDVSVEEQVLRFRDEVLKQHVFKQPPHGLNLVFSNAGLSGGGSFVLDSREEWERAFASNWCGVYYCARAFLPMLTTSGDGVLVNTSSMNGYWATAGPGRPASANSTADFAIRGFTEGLIEDLRVNLPQVRVAVVMPGSVGTNFGANAFRVLGLPPPEQMTDAQITELSVKLHDRFVKFGLDFDGQPPEAMRNFLAAIAAAARDQAPLSAADAATIILDGVRSGAWRILVGEDAKVIDERVRANPEAAYDYAQLFDGLAKPPWQ